MKRPESHVEPVPDILPLSAIDQFFVSGLQSHPLDSDNSDDICLFLHEGVRQSVYMGTHILEMLLSSISGRNEHLPVVMLYRQALEVGDSIGTLLRMGSVDVSAIASRTLFELSLELEFLLKGHTFHEDRANCFLAWSYQKELEKAYLEDQGTPEGQQYLHDLRSDTLIGDANYPIQDFSEKREKIKNTLSEEKYRRYMEIYMENKGKRNHWYSLCSNSNSIRNLAEHLKRLGSYRLLYTMLPGKVHGTDIFRGNIEIDTRGMLFIRQLRGPVSQIETVAHLVIGDLGMCHASIVGTYLSGNDQFRRFFMDWYMVYRKFSLQLGSEVEAEGAGRQERE